MTHTATVAERRAIRIANAPSLDAPLAEVRDYVHEGLIDGGVVCPACGQECQARRRSFRATHARALLALSRYPDSYVKIKNLVSGVDKEGGDKIQLKHWGFIEELPRNKVGPDGAWHQGYYRITAAGIAFAEGRARASAAYYGYNSRVVDWVQDTVDIYDAIGREFDLSEVLTSVMAEEAVGDFILISDLRDPETDELPADPTESA